MGDFADNIINSFYMWMLEMVAISLWWFTRWMLIWARQLEAIRMWLVEDVLWNAYSMFGGFLYPGLLLSLMVLVIVYVASFMLQGLIEQNPVRLKKVLPSLIVTGFIFLLGSKGLVAFLYILQLTGQVGMVSGMYFAVDASTVDYMVNTDADGRESVNTEAESLYGANSPTCPDLDTRRRAYSIGAPGFYPSFFHLNDAAALMAGANTIDIHCPPTSQVLPALFRTGDNDAFQGYFPLSGEDFSEMSPSEQRPAITLAMIGVNRLIVALVTAAGSLIEQLLMIVFVLGATATFFTMVGSRLLAWYEPFAGLAEQQMMACGAILWRYFMAFLWIGIFLGMTLVGFSTSGNIFIGAGLALATLCVVIYQFWESRHAIGGVGKALTSFARAVPYAAVKTVAGPAAALLKAQRQQSRQGFRPQPRPAASNTSGNGMGWKAVAAGAGLGAGARFVAGAAAGVAGSYVYNRYAHRRAPPPPAPQPTTTTLAPAQNNRRPSWATTREYAVYKPSPKVIEGTVTNRSSAALPEQKRLPGGTTS